jgi:CRISPR-associated protein Cas1
MKNYYVLSNGRIRRDQNTIFIDNEATGTKKPIPVEDVDSIYLYGEVDLNTKLLNFLTQKKIPLHVFNYYGYYSGSYYPREYLNSGYIVVQQVGFYADPVKRLAIARETVHASAHSILKNIGYYMRRSAGKDSASGTLRQDESEPPGEIGMDGTPVSTGVPGDADVEAAVDAAEDGTELNDVVEDSEADGDSGNASGAGDSDLSAILATITRLAAMIDRQSAISDLMGVEGKMRERYYEAWHHILRDDWEFERRVRRPPDNEVNALISFGNSMLYTVCASEIYRTQLLPTISYLHEPGARRFSLALDVSELFKPLIVDRAIFRLLNTRQLTPSHFDKSLDGCVLNDMGKRLFLGAMEERLGATIRHRRLGRHVSYRHLIRLECYKLIRHLTGIETYRAFRAWW